MRSRLGRRLAAHLEGPAIGVVAEDDDVADAVGIAADLAEHIVDFLSVRPGFHEARRQRRPRAHVRSCPLHARARDRRKRTAPPLSANAVLPRRDQLAAGEAVEPFESRRTSSLPPLPMMLGQSGVIGLERSVGLQRHLGGEVPDVQVADDGVDRPALERGRLVERSFVQRLRPALCSASLSSRKSFASARMLSLPAQKRGVHRRRGNLP